MNRLLAAATFVFALVVLPATLSACTTAVLSGRCTPDGRPMLWKHRDIDKDQNRLAFFTDGKYDYIGLLNTRDTEGKEIWAGMNSVGFAVMNSFSYNLIPDDEDLEEDHAGKVMKTALRTCATVDEFEHLLKGLKRPMRLATNFGVLDSQGNAAYFEVGNTSYKKFDANNPKQAPNGYLIRSNHSATGDEDDGFGYIRRKNAERIFKKAHQQDGLTPRFLVQKASRHLKHSLTGRDLYDEAAKLPGDSFRFVSFRDYIPRQKSVSMIVLQGVRPGEDPKLGTIWTVLGFPLTSAVVPTWVATGPALPKILQGSSMEHPAPLCDLALELKAKCFPITRGSGPYYLDLPRLVNRDETGIIQQIAPVENRLFEKAAPMLDQWRTNGGFNPTEAKAFYDWVDTEWFDAFKEATEEKPKGSENSGQPKKKSVGTKR